MFTSHLPGADELANTSLVKCRTINKLAPFGADLHGRMAYLRHTIDRYWANYLLVGVGIGRSGWGSLAIGAATSQYRTTNPKTI